MNILRKSIRWCALLAALVASVAVLLRGRVISDLRFQNGVLRSANDSVAVTADTSSDSTEESERLRRENQDLLKLRNQVRQLRSQSPELAAARAENQRLMQASQKSAEARQAPPVDPSQFTSKEALIEAGLSTPEAAIQSFFRSMRDGDVQRFVQCAAPDFLQRIGLDQKSEQELLRFIPKLKETMGGFRNYRIVERREVSPDQVVLVLQSSAGRAMVQIVFERLGNEWRVNPPF